MNASSLRAMGSSGQIVGGSTPTVGVLPAITGSGVVRIDPHIGFAATPTGVNLSVETMPGLLADSAPAGGVVTVRRSGAPSMPCVVAVSLRAPHATVPWLPDPIWLASPGCVIAAAGITPLSGPFVVTMNVPSVATLRGFQIVWQAADLPSTGLLAVSNPSPSFVH